MLGTLFSVIEVAFEHLSRRVDAAKIRVCSVLYTDVADCVLVAILPYSPGSPPQKTYHQANAVFSWLSEVDSFPWRSLRAQTARTTGDDDFGA